MSPRNSTGGASAEAEAETAPKVALGFVTGMGERDTHALVLNDGRPNPHPSAGWPYSTVTGLEIAKMVHRPPTGVAKAEARWFIASTYREHDARDHAVQRQRGEFRWLCADIDQGNPPLATVLEALRAAVGELATLTYATRSATLNDRRWRVLVPLAGPLPGVDYADTQRAFFDLLEANGLVLDRSLAGPGQLVYLPNKGEYYEHSVIKQQRLELDADHPIIQLRDKTRQDRAEAKRAARAWREQKARERAARGDSGQLPGEHFNERHAISDLLNSYGYTQAGGSNDWRSPYQTSKTYATRDYGDYWISLSGSDAAKELGHQSKKEHRFGDAFDLYVHYKHGGDLTEAVRSYAEEAQLGRNTSGDTAAGFGNAPGDDSGGRSNPGGGTSSDEEPGAAGGKTDNPGTAGGAAGRQKRHNGRNHQPPPPGEPLFRPWEVIDPLTLPPRDFIYGRHYIREFASVTLAPGGGSKSTIIMGESIAIATDRPILGVKPKRRERTVYFCAEDPADEIKRRVLAICQHFQIPQSELVDWLFIASGRDQDVTLAYGLDGEINEPVFEMMERFAKAYEPGVMNFDPLQAMTTSPETNETFHAVGRRLSALAETARCSIGLAHHLRKLGGREAEIEDSRGGIALVDAVRSARVLNPMTKDEAKNAGLPTHIDHLRVDGAGIGKTNLSRPSERADWYRRVSVSLPNGDNVAVVEPWNWPDPFAAVTTADALRVQRAIAACAEPPRENSQANDWAGYVVAKALGITASKAERPRISAMIKTWIETDVLRVDTIKDTRHSRDVRVIVAGDNRLDEAE